MNLSKDVNRIVVLGKGGVGKSTFSSNLSAWYALQGHKVLHVGCDPKGDSSLILLKDIVNYRTVVTLLAQHKDEPSGIINEGRHGIDCIEVGGPESGVGCGGRGIARALEFMEQARTIERGNYDVVIFDVLGDVVCGGFAAPMREGFGNKVVIVASEDEQSFYAANNISRAVVRYAVNGVALTGIVLNRGVAGEPGLAAADFAARINTTMVGSLPLCETMSQARLQRLTSVEHDPDCPFSKAVGAVAARLLETAVDSLPLPTPMDAVSFFSFATGTAAGAPPIPDAPGSGSVGQSKAPSPVPLAEVLGERKGTLLAGPETVQKFSEVLGTEKPALAPLQLKLRSVQAREDQTIWLSLASPVAGNFMAILKDKDTGPAFASGDHLDVAYSAPHLSAMAQQLLQHAARRFGRYRLTDLFRLIANDPGTSRALPPGDKDAGDSAPATRQGLRGGPETVDHFRSLLWPEGAAGAATLDHVDLKDNGTVWLAVTGPDLPDNCSIILQSAGTGGAFVETGEMDIAYQGEELTEGLKKLLSQVADRLGSGPLQSHAEVILADQQRTVLGTAPDEAGEARLRTRDDWARFFADDQFKRNVFHAFTMDAPYISIEHCDMECHYATPTIDNTLLDSYNYPWLQPGPQGSSQQEHKDSLVSYFQTQLTEMDVVHGSAERLREVMDGVLEDLGDHQLIMVNNACTPIVAGDDVESMLKGLGRTCPVPIMHLGPRAGMHPVLDFFKTAKAKRGFADCDKQPNSVNLVGFPDRADTEELIAGLGALGIGLNTRPFPLMEMSLFDNYLAAPLQIFLPNKYFTSLYQELFEDLPIDTVSPSAPYGMARTRQWFEMVGDKVGPAGSWRKELEAQENRHLAQWETLSRKASAHVLGFVVTPEATKRLTDESAGYGVPMAQFLSEAGFHLDILALASDSQDEQQQQISSAFPADRVMFRTFESPDEMAQLISGSPARAFFSDHYFDHRLSGAGKAQFSLQFFQMGFAGAVRTLQRLLRTCEVPFFDRYGQYLGRTR